MLNDAELGEYFDLHNLSPNAREYIRLTRDNEPSRVVGRNARKNVCTWVASRKMGLSIQTESGGAEKRYAYEFEYDRNVLEYWDQPPTLTINKTNKHGVVRNGLYTPDFLVLHKDGPTVEEVKTEEGLQRLVETNPSDWTREGEKYAYRPAAEKFGELGLPFVVRSASTLNAIRSSNIELLLMARGAPQAWDGKLRSEALKRLSQCAWLTLDSIAKSLGITDLTSLYQLIDLQVHFSALDDELLTIPEFAWIATSPDLIAQCRQMRLNTGNAQSTGELPTISIDTVPTTKAATDALRKMDLLANGAKGRSARRWAKQIEDGLREGKTVFQSLLSKTDRRGNRDTPLDEHVVEFLRDYIKTVYATSMRSLPSAAYSDYRSRALEALPLLTPVSAPTFRNYIREADQVALAEGRGGLRSANAAASPSPVDKRGLKPVLPFVLAIVDHYHCDVETIVAKTQSGVVTARPWLTVLVDVATGGVLAVWLSYRTPSRRAVGMILRMCVRRWGRLPKTILMDHGSEFESVYTLALLAALEVHRSLRPVADPRYGSEGERHFGIFKSKFLALRWGNLAAYRESRSVSSSHAPKNVATLTLKDLWDDLLAYVDWHNDTLIGSRPESASVCIAETLHKMPFVGVKIEDTHEFRLATCVDAGHYTVDPTRGIHIDDNKRYWAPELSALAGQRKKPEVRIDPEDPYVVHTRVAEQWVPCLAQGRQQFCTMDPVARWSEATRLLDGRAVREAAKQSASDDLAKAIREMDANRKEDAAPIVTETPKPAAAERALPKLSRLLSDTFGSLGTKTWGAN